MLADCVSELLLRLCTLDTTELELEALACR